LPLRCGCISRTSAASATSNWPRPPIFDPPIVADPPHMTRKFQGFDVGGSSVKAGLVDVDTGRIIGELLRQDTPRPATASPAAVMEAIAGLSRRMAEPGNGVGIALPSVVQKGVAR